MTAPVGTSLFDVSVLDAVELAARAAGRVASICSSPIRPTSRSRSIAPIGTTTRLKHSKASSNDWFSDLPERALRRAVRRGLSACSSATRTSICFCDAETMFVAKPEAEQAGFRFWKPLVWDKRTIGMGYHYRARYEFILFFEKGKRRLNDLGIADIISVPRIRGGYPAEKPCGGLGGADPPELAARRARRRSVHGLGQRRRRRAEAGPPVPRQRSQSRGGAICRRSGCASSARARAPAICRAAAISPTCSTLIGSRDDDRRATTPTSSRRYVSQALRRRAG